MAKQAEGKAPKEIAQHIKEAKAKLKTKMDQQLLAKADLFDKCKKEKDHDGYWKAWSTAIEKAWLTFLGHEGRIKKALVGR